MPTIGDEKWIDGPTYGASASWDDDVTMPPAVWQLEDGWTVLNYYDQRSGSYGHASLNVSFIQANGTYASTTDVQGMYDQAINIAVRYGDDQYAAYLRNKKSWNQQVVANYSANHSTVSATASASGSHNIVDETGAAISGKLKLHLLFIGTPYAVQQMSLAAIRNYIRVHIVNNTQLTVSFFLNGGGGSNMQIAPRQGQDYLMIVDPGIPPLVGIFQPNGGRLNYSLADNKRYAFNKNASGEIVCSYA